MNFTLGHVLCDVNLYYGLIGAPQIIGVLLSYTKYSILYGNKILQTYEEHAWHPEM